MTANTPASRKAKGRRLQQKIARDIAAAFDLAETDVRSNPMGCSGCDVWLSESARIPFPFAVEAKNQEAWSIPKWWEQAAANAQTEGLYPLLVVAKNGETPLAILHWSHLIEFMKTIKMLKDEK